MTAAPKPCACPAPTRRSVLATAGATAFLVPAAGLVAPAPARAGFAEQPATPQDEAFMRRTIDLAKANDKRFAAIIVSDGEVIVEGINEVRGADGRRDPTAHGEMIAIRACVATRGAGALVGATLYTTGEPCPMCMGAIVWSRIARVVYAASIEQMATKLNQIMMPCTEIAAASPFLEISVTGGVMAEEALALFG